MSGQIVDATIVAAPKQRNTIEEKTAIKEGRISDDWKDKPAKLAQKDRDARWTGKYTKARSRERMEAGRRSISPFRRSAIEPCLYRPGLRADPQVDDDARGRLEDVPDRKNTASDVWADTDYRSAKNEAMLTRRGLVSRIHRKKPPGRPMPDRMRIANAQKSRVRSAVEHVFAHQKDTLVVRTIGIARAKVKIGMTNLVYNIRRFVWLRTKDAAA